MNNFDKYWDTRIEHHHKLFDEKPGLANLLYDEALLAYEQCEKDVAEETVMNQTCPRCLCAKFYKISATEFRCSVCGAKFCRVEDNNKLSRENTVSTHTKDDEVIAWSGLRIAELELELAELRSSKAHQTSPHNTYIIWGIDDVKAVCKNPHIAKMFHHLEEAIFQYRKNKGLNKNANKL